MAITILRRSHPEFTDYWDGNWLRAEVEVAADGFRGFVAGDLRAEEIARFREELFRLLDAPTETATFATMEGWLSIRAVGDRKVHIQLDCELRDQVGTGNRLIFKLACHQTFLAPIVAQLDSALHRYPVFGSPAD